MTEQSTQNRKINPRMIVGVIVFLLYTPLVLFISSGQLDWWMAWVYSIVAVVLSLGSRVLMARRHPDLVAERASFREAEGVKEWDKKLVPLVAQVGPFMILLVAGLDKRFGWSPQFALWVSLAAFADRHSWICIQHMGFDGKPVLLLGCAHPNRSRPHRMQQRTLSICPTPRLRGRFNLVSNDAADFRITVGLYPDHYRGCSDRVTHFPGR